ncbi:MAG: hypothetical protein AMS27_15920 [Bacteroides sp. SM23_62_1]|nr:MAG: hypothetical protein AMS27_15920 [Bacteroides sp. SM23_62_1]
MKAKRFNTLFLGLGILFFSSQWMNAQNEVKKEFHEEFKADKNTILTVDNKYGDVDLKDWGNPAVKIDVVITVKNTNAEKAERLLSYIDVVISQEGNTISAKTVFDEKFSKSSSWRDDNDLNIDYTIQMPRDIELNLYNKYGNVFISEITGKATIGLKYGKLKANRIFRGDVKPLSEIDLGYSDASIEECSWLKVNMKYSKLNLTKSTAVILLSKYSTFNMDEGSSVVIESKYDHYEFGDLSNLVVNTAYSGIKVNEVKEKLSCETSYTDCHVGYIPPAFESIDINTKYGGYRIGIDPNASYNLDGFAEYAKIQYHDAGNVSRIVENTSMKVFGTVGKNASPTANVKVLSKYGNIRLTD